MTRANIIKHGTIPVSSYLSSYLIYFISSGLEFHQVSKPICQALLLFVSTLKETGDLAKHSTQMSPRNRAMDLKSK